MEPAGIPLQRLRLNSVPLLSRCGPDWSWTRTLPDYDLWYVLEGVGELELNGTRHPVTGGVCALLRPGDRVSASQDPARPLTVFRVHFDFRDERGRPLPLHAALAAHSVVRVGDASTYSVLARACAQCGRRAGGLSELLARRYVELLLLQFWEEASRAAAPGRDRRIEAIVSAIQQEPGRDWRVDELAREACLSRSQFSRRFRQATGMSPSSFAIRVRLERAQLLLRETDQPVGEIAAALGYSDTAFFSRQFRRYYGQAPGAVRGHRVRRSRPPSG